MVVARRSDMERCTPKANALSLLRSEALEHAWRPSTLERERSQLFSGIRECDLESHRLSVGPAIVPRGMPVGDFSLAHWPAVLTNVRTDCGEHSIRSKERLVDRSSSAVVLDSGAIVGHYHADMLPTPVTGSHRTRWRFSTRRSAAEQHQCEESTYEVSAHVTPPVSGRPDSSKSISRRSPAIMTPVVARPQPCSMTSWFSPHRGGMSLSKEDKI